MRIRQAQALLRLCDRHGPERVNAVCARAIGFDVYEVPRVERLLGLLAHRYRARKSRYIGTRKTRLQAAWTAALVNLNPIGRVWYAFSTSVCVPASLGQEVGAALGAQAGEKRIGEVVREGGFTRFRKAAGTPFNMVLEARL